LTGTQSDNTFAAGAVNRGSSRTFHIPVPQRILRSFDPRRPDVWAEWWG
jgi:hypothetical protein